MVVNRFVGERFGFPLSADVLVGDVFFVCDFGPLDPTLAAALANSAITYLSAEVLSRKTYGVGVAYLYGPEVTNLAVCNPKQLSAADRQRIRDAYDQLLNRDMQAIRVEIGNDDRRYLDCVIGEALGLDTSIIAELYSALADMVAARLAKADSASQRPA